MLGILSVVSEEPENAGIEYLLFKGLLLVRPDLEVVVTCDVLPLFLKEVLAF